MKGKSVNKNTAKYLIDWDKKSRSKLQFKVKQFLKDYWDKHIVYEEFPVYGTLLKVDFFNATKKIIIEVQGDQHKKFNSFFHNNSRVYYWNQIKRDYSKIEWAKANGIRFLEIYEDEVDNLSESFFKNKFKLNL